MPQTWIKNSDDLATTPNRKTALEIMEAGLNAISTHEVIKNKIKLDNNILIVDSQIFDLNEFKNIKVIGFGKSSGVAALTLEEILGDKITAGAVVSLEKVDCKYIETFAGTHPRPSAANTEAGKKIYELISGGSSEDLIIVLVSGGGSALLCYPEDEYAQGAKLYDAFLQSGKTISEINTVRKHLSLLKGGGLAKLAYPATVVGLIFSDVPGDIFENVASGATYKDNTTIADAQKIVTENNLGEYNLIETPKEDKYFEKVYNFVLVSNKTAVEAMEKKGEELGLQTKIISTDLYDEVSEALKKIFSSQKENTVSLAAGEPSVVVPEGAGKGGRNLHMGLEAIKNKLISDDSVFISFASDGVDNSDVAGAIVDKATIEKAEKLGLKAEDYANNFNSYDFFQKTGDQIITGPTGANVSDLMILLTKK
ncbi:DUF4147 domain-containing protein [Candidatus Nomurabacteria bacterium]|nr:DUF4147 domain-containing protein [Candidatus Nomurabacteria bacterium]